MSSLEAGARLIILLKGHSQSLLLLNIKRGEAEEVALTIGGKGQSIDTILVEIPTEMINNLAVASLVFIFS